jgi:hypothetical protein
MLVRGTISFGQLGDRWGLVADVAVGSSMTLGLAAR